MKTKSAVRFVACLPACLPSLICKTAIALTISLSIFLSPQKVFCQPLLNSDSSQVEPSLELGATSTQPEGEGLPSSFSNFWGVIPSTPRKVTYILGNFPNLATKNLYWAIVHHNLLGVKDALRNGASLYYADDNGSYAIHDAIIYACVRDSINSDANPEALDIIDELLNAYEKHSGQSGLNILNSYWQTPLNFAARTGRWEVFERVYRHIDYSVSKGIFDLDGRNPLQNALLYSSWFFYAAKSNQIALFLLINTTDPNELTVRDHMGDTLLHLASVGNDESIVKELLFRLTEDIINAKNNFGMTALHCSVNNSPNPEVVSLLIKGLNKASIVAKDKNGQTALHVLAMNAGFDGRSDAYGRITRELVLAGINPNEKDKLKRTALHWAASNTWGETNINALYIIQELVMYRYAKINEVDADGDTPLDRAIKFGNKKIADFLRSAGGKRAKDL